MKRWYSRDWTEYETVKENDAQTEDVKVALEEAVHRQLMSDVPYGVLLSGGLDSSVISAIAKNMRQTYRNRRCKRCMVASTPLFRHRSKGRPRFD